MTTWLFAAFGAATAIFLGVVVYERWRSPAAKLCLRCGAQSSYLTKGRICQECAEAEEQ